MAVSACNPKIKENTHIAEIAQKLRKALYYLNTHTYIYLKKKKTKSLIDNSQQTTISSNKKSSENTNSLKESSPLILSCNPLTGARYVKESEEADWSGNSYCKMWRSIPRQRRV